MLYGCLITTKQELLCQRREPKHVINIQDGGARKQVIVKFIFSVTNTFLKKKFDSKHFVQFKDNLKKDWRFPLTVVLFVCLFVVLIEKFVLEFVCPASLCCKLKMALRTTSYLLPYMPPKD